MKRTVDTPAGRVTYELIRTVHPQAQVTALPGGTVRVCAPTGVSLRDADALVQREAQALCARLRRLDGPQCVGGCASIGETAYDLRAESDRAQLTALAQEHIVQRLAYWHARIGGNYASVTVSDLGVKWGACDQAHNLAFSWRLILAPSEALDYVVIHELCHLHEFSHSERFWKLVQQQMPEYEAWKKWLAAHKRELMQ